MTGTLRRHAARWVSVVGLVLVAALALSGCGGSSTVTTVIEEVPASTTATSASTVATVTQTVSEPTTTAAAVSAPCTASLLFAAAAAKEGFNPNSPGYNSLRKFGQGPGAYSPNCFGGWATAGISRPSVGTTDGLTLFDSTGGSWQEAAELGDVAVECNLEANGVPASVAAVLSKGVKGASVAGCDDPDAFSEARSEWKSSYCDDAADQSGDWKATALSLKGAQPDYAGNPTGYKASIIELNQLATLPDTDVSKAQAAVIQSDQTALDNFFNTPGLFVSANEPSC